MDKTHRTADRVRPILQAMERSIDAARQQRLGASGRGATDRQEPTAPAPLRSPVPVRPAAVADDSSSAPPRLKARPKRSVPGFSSTTLHSRAS